MTTPNQTDAIRPNILGLLELLDHYLEEDEAKRSEATVEAACAPDADAQRRLVLERDRLRMVQESRLEVAVLRQRVHQLVERVVQGEAIPTEAVMALLPLPVVREAWDEEPLF